jgi:hypothetical protein
MDDIGCKSMLCHCPSHIILSDYGLACSEEVQAEMDVLARGIGHAIINEVVGIGHDVVVVDLGKGCGFSFFLIVVKWIFAVGGK